jgi:hypothetical protein
VRVRCTVVSVVDIFWAEQFSLKVPPFREAGSEVSAIDDFYSKPFMIIADSSCYGFQ